MFGKLVQGFLDFFNNLFSVFKKSPTEKVQDRKEDERENDENFKNTGRPGKHK